MQLAKIKKIYITNSMKLLQTQSWNTHLFTCDEVALPAATSSAAIILCHVYAITIGAS
jgi:hypothetical protein